MSEEQVNEAVENEVAAEPEQNQDVTHSRPEHVPEKFWNGETGEVMVDDVLKSYAEMEKHMVHTQ